MITDPPIPGIQRNFERPSPGTARPWHVGLPIIVGGAATAPGDILVGDADGVVVVTRQMAATEAAKLAAVRAAAILFRQM